LSPNGGESYKAGDTINVRWNTNNFGTLGVWLTLADKYGTTVPGGKLNAANIPNNGSYAWTIPSDIVPAGTSGAFKVVAASFDNGPSASDLSDSYFNINSPTTAVSIPVTPANTQPILDSTNITGGTLDASGNIHVSLGNSIILTARSHDPDGTIVSADFVDSQGINRCHVTNSSLTSLASATIYPALNCKWTPEAVGTYSLRAYVGDNGGAYSSTYVIPSSVIVEKQYVAPTNSSSIWDAIAEYYKKLGM
jgi:hypothetical protein